MRITKSVARHKRKKKLMKFADGFRDRRKNCFNVAVDKIYQKLLYQYRDRRNKKRDMRALWITRITAGLKALGTSYSKFFGKLKTNPIALNRKSLAELAFNNQDTFNNIVNQVMSKP